MRGRSLTAVSFLWVGVALSAGPLAAQAPDEDWRSLETPHFRVTFPAELEPVGQRAAERAERAYESLSRMFVDPPEGRIELLVTDHADFSNGFASAVPYNRITIFVRPPMEGFNLSYFDDWIETVVTHELSHIFHLERTSPLGSAVRKVFGRVSATWPSFPGFGVPKWVTEGLATYYESSLTESGRVRGSFHDMVLRTAVLEGGFERFDQVSGESPDWPAGNRRYVYGATFIDHLQETYGEERMGRFVEAFAGHLIPYRLNAGAREGFGIGFDEAWAAWVVELEAEYRALADSLAAAAPITRGEALTREGRQALFARVSPDGSRVAYVRSDGLSDVQLRVANPDGSASRRLARVSNLVNFAWLPDGAILASQLEFTDPYRIRSDLVHIDASGRERRVTRGARLDQPAPSADGLTALAVQDGEGTNRVVIVDLETGDVRPLTPFAPDEHWAYPVWSPDGRWIAVSHWRPGAFYDLVVMDGDGRVVHRVTADRAVDQAATWSPDGRWLLWASDRSGIPNLYAVPIDPTSGAPGTMRQVTNMLGGAEFPSVDPTGGWIYFSSYHVRGWDIERIPFDPGTWFDPLPAKPGFVSGGESASEAFARRLSQPSGPYQPLHTLRPYFWEPRYQAGVARRGREVLGQALGAGTDGRDLVGRHAYAAEVLFRSSGRTDAFAAYSNASLGNPVLGLSFSQDHAIDGPFTVEPEPGETTPVFLAERERRIRASVTLTRRRMRTRTTLSLSLAHVWENLELLDLNLDDSPLRLARPDRRLGEATAVVAFSNARSFAFSTTPEAGFRGFLRGRVRRELALADSLRGTAGRDRAFQEVTGELAAYRAFSGPGFSNHVLAGRASFGVAGGPGADAFHFNVGGAQGSEEDLTGFGLFGGVPLLFPVRGYFQGQRFGRYAWTASAEYRFPILNAHRGVGLFPLHVDRVSGALFVDAGNAWGPNDPGVGGNFLNPRRVTLGAVGAELQTSVLALFSTRLFFRLGAAIKLNDEAGDPIYLRVGTAF